MLKGKQDFCLCAFLLSLGFEYWDPFGLVGIISISKIIFILYILTLMPQIREFIKPKFNKGIVYSIICWVMLYYIVCYAYYQPSRHIVIASSTILLNITMCFIIANHIIIKGRRVLVKILIMISIIPLVQFVLITNKIGYSLSEDGRLLFFGDNPNNVGMIAAISFMISIVLIFDNFLLLSKKRFFLSLSALSAIAVILATQSRGAILSVALGLILFVLLRKLPIGRKLFFILLLSGVTSGLFFVLEDSESVFLRMQELFTEGDQSRMVLYDEIRNFAYDNPVFGLGETGYYDKMWQYRGEFKATHNGFLDIYLYTGVVGVLFFFIFLVYMIRFCWRLHQRRNLSLPLILFAIVLLNFAKSGSGWNCKIMWIIFSIVIGMYYIYNDTKMRSYELGFY